MLGIIDWWAEYIVDSFPASPVVSAEHNCLLQGVSIQLSLMRSLFDCKTYKQLVLPNAWSCAGQQRSVALYQVGVRSLVEATHHKLMGDINRRELVQARAPCAKRKRAALCPRAFHIDRKHHLELAWQRQQVTLLVTSMA